MDGDNKSIHGLWLQSYLEVGLGYGHAAGWGNNQGATYNADL